MMHLVRGDSAASARSGSMVKVAGSTSTRTGVAPAPRMAAMVGAHVLAAVTTSWPAPTPSASRARRSASVPLPTATPCPTPEYFAKARSISAPDSPRTKRPRSNTRPTSVSRPARMLWILRRMSRNGTRSGDIVRPRLAVEVQRPGQALGEGDPRPPVEARHGLAEVGVVVADIDGAPLLGKGHDAVAAGAGQPDEEGGEVAEIDGGLGPQVEHLAHGLVRGRRDQESLDCVVHVVEVAELRAVAVHVDVLTVEEIADPDAEEGLSRARLHDTDVAVVLAARLEDGELGPAVDLEVRVGVCHRVHVARLPGQVEEHVTAAHELAHAVLVPNVGDIDGDVLLDARHVEEVAAVLRDERVHEDDVGALLEQPPGEVAPDEAEPARDENLETPEGASHGDRLRRRAHSAPAPRPAASR